MWPTAQSLTPSAWTQSANFAGEAAIRSPLTSDYQVVSGYLKDLVAGGKLPWGNSELTGGTAVGAPN